MEEALFAEPSLGFYCVRTRIIGIILIHMPEGTYKFNKQFTEAQREEDSDHGIYENQHRSIEFVAPNNFKYTYHYFYEYENGYYEVVKQQTNDTVFSGTYVVDGNKILATVLAGEQKVEDGVDHKDLAWKGNITGTITFEEIAEGIKVVDYTFNTNKLDRQYRQQE